MWKVWRRKNNKGKFGKLGRGAASPESHLQNYTVGLRLAGCLHPEALILSFSVMRYFFAFWDFFFHSQMPTMIICNFRNKGAQKQHLWVHIFLWDLKCMSYACLQPGAIYSQTSFLCTPFSSGPDWLQGLNVVPRLTLSLQRVSSTS